MVPANPSNCMIFSPLNSCSNVNWKRQRGSLVPWSATSSCILFIFALSKHYSDPPNCQCSQSVPDKHLDPPSVSCRRSLPFFLGESKKLFLIRPKEPQFLPRSAGPPLSGPHSLSFTQEWRDNCFITDTAWHLCAASHMPRTFLIKFPLCLCFILRSRITIIWMTFMPIIQSATWSSGQVF